MFCKTLREIADLLQGQVIGDENKVVYGVTNIDEVTEREITFAVAPHIEKAAKSSAGAIIVGKGNEKEFTQALIVVENPRVAFALLLEDFSPPLDVKRQIHASAVVSPSATIGKNVAIMPCAVIEDGVCIGDNTVVYPNVYLAKNVKVGNDSIIYSNVSVYAGCVIGDRVIIHSGATIGADGFGYVTIGREHKKVPQVGNVVLHDDVEIGANSCIDCGTTGSTVIGKGTKIDNLVHVGHNDIIGENCFLVAFVGLPGSVKVGNNVTFAGQVGSVGHINIGNNCVFAGRAGITNDVPDNSIYAGFPAQPHREWLKQEAMQRKMPEIMKKLKDLEKKISFLEKNEK